MFLIIATIAYAMRALKYHQHEYEHMRWIEGKVEVLEKVLHDIRRFDESYSTISKEDLVIAHKLQCLKAEQALCIVHDIFIELKLLHG